MRVKKWFLILAFCMVTLIALLYGVNPSWFGRTYLGLSTLDTNVAHILRAIMGLYIALGLFWLYAAFHAPLRNVGILVAGLFCGGLLSGRLISLLIEGMPPSPLLVFYLLVELTLIPFAYWVYTRDDE